MASGRMPQPEGQKAAVDKYERTRSDHSSGGVAYRKAPNGGYQIALIATRNWKRWQLPKGSVEPYETSEETAIREVEEEAGLRTLTDSFLRSIDYWYWDTYRREKPELVHKTVDFYLLRVMGGDLSDSSHEVDGVGWFTFEHALEKLTFKGEAEVVRTAWRILSGKLPATDAPL